MCSKRSLFTGRPRETTGTGTQPTPACSAPLSVCLCLFPTTATERCDNTTTPVTNLKMPTSVLLPPLRAKPTIRESSSPSLIRAHKATLLFCRLLRCYTAHTALPCPKKKSNVVRIERRLLLRLKLQCPVFPGRRRRQKIFFFFSDYDICPERGLAPRFGRTYYV